MKTSIKVKPAKVRHRARFTKLGAFLAVDTETTGTDLRHGDLPFAVSACDHEGNTHLWEWRVDPMTRIPIVPTEDKREIRTLFSRFDVFVYHNIRFDVRALELLDCVPDGLHIGDDDWTPHFHDTLLMSHVLDNLDDHSLKGLSLQYLDILDDDEEELRAATISARAHGKNHGWKLGVSLTGRKEVARDYWMVKEMDPSSTLLSKYSTIDAERTALLAHLFHPQLIHEGLTTQYELQKRTILPTFRMESVGVSLRQKTLRAENKRYKSEAEECKHDAVRRAVNHAGATEDLNLSSPKQLEKVLFGDYDYDSDAFVTNGSFGLPILKQTKTGASTDKNTLAVLLNLTGPLRSSTRHAYRFLEDLRDYKKNLTASKYLVGYEQYQRDWRLHPSFNPTGTATTRYSSSNPNAQNVGKGDEWEDEHGDSHEEFKLREVFGPSRGRIWYAIDYSQLQLRIFAHVSGEQSLLTAFDEGYDFHQFVACKIFNCTPEEVTPRQRRIAKGVNFGIIFGAGSRKIDATAGIPGLYDLFRAQFPSVDAYMESTSRFAHRHGYVLTPGGYRLYLRKDQYGKIKGYTGVNYVVQGSEGEIVKRAFVDCDRYLTDTQGDHGGFTTLQVHDELVFDFEKRSQAKIESEVIPRLRKLMEDAGAFYGMKTPVDVDRITRSWAKGESLE